MDPDFWDNVKGSLQAYLLTVEGIVDACGIVIGQEFTEVTPTKLSFWWVGRAAFRQAAEELTAAYGGLPQFRGLSVDDMDACQEVGEDPRRW